MWLKLGLIAVLQQIALGLNELHIGGIFPIGGKGGWQGGQACMPAAKMALADVNKREDLLPGYQLILHSNDSEVSVGGKIVILVHFLQWETALLSSFVLSGQVTIEVKKIKEMAGKS